MIDAPDAGPDRVGGRSWPRWLLAWLVGVGGAIVVGVIVGYLAPQLGWAGIIVALIGGALVMGGVGGAHGVRQWLLVVVAEVVGWTVAVVLIGLALFWLTFVPDVAR